MHKQAVRGDTARHEVVVRVAEDVQLLGGNLCTEGRKKKTYLQLPAAQRSRVSTPTAQRSPRRPLRRTCTCSHTPPLAVRPCAAASAG